MLTRDIRQQFLDYFAEHGHEIVPSSSVVLPHDDTLLFANAGMNQFKDVFLGTGSRPYRRAASTQKCIRVSGKHNDLEEVGEDTYHHTFFEMLGNWSFDDYGKQEAITMAWQLLTVVWGLEKERLYVTIYEGDAVVPRDDEAEHIWRELTDVDPDHILAFGSKDNFWEMGDTGPCGPCSEIHYDRGEDFNPADGSDCFVNLNCDRFIEIWNLVFIQYSKDSDGALSPLPKKHIDTGLGLERLASILQKVRSNYDIDVFKNIITAIAELSGVPYSEEEGKPHRVIADHVRTLTFAIGDGVQPSNEGRGYVLRRLLRRAARFGRELGVAEPFVFQLVEVVVTEMGEHFPEIVERRETIANVIRREEELFGRTLDKGLELFRQVCTDVQHGDTQQIDGTAAFRLYDTYGFPLDLTVQMATEAGLAVDVAGYEEAMAQQREQSREGQRDAGEIPEENWTIVESLERSEFLGYEELTATAAIAAYILLDDGRAALVLDRTPFYAESGGQTGDHGVIVGQDWHLDVRETQYLGDWIVHLGELVGRLTPDQTVKASVNPEYRQAIAANHTATHMLQAALRQVLGDQVRQEGSLVAPGYLRFDFNYDQKLEPHELERVEKIVNERVRQNLPVNSRRMAYADAISAGATALFGEKYGDEVRVVELPGFSTELCGGTHVVNTGEVGLFIIRQETAAAQGVRRIEALTGGAAWEYFLRQRRSLLAIRDLLSSHGSDEVEKLQKTLGEKQDLAKEVLRLRERLGEGLATDLIKNATRIGEVAIVSHYDPALDRKALLQLADALRAEMERGVVLLATIQNEKPFLILAVTDSLVSKGVKAGQLIGEVAALVDGKGGGKPHLAQAGGNNSAGLELLATRGVELLEKQLQSLL